MLAPQRPIEDAPDCRSADRRLKGAAVVVSSPGAVTVGLTATALAPIRSRFR